jgi:cysteine/glycine-rich protein
MSFIGTQQKCKACEKTVYPVDQLSADGTSYHKACFRCSHCKGTLKVDFFFAALLIL